jgi:hypothetical protein
MIKNTLPKLHLACSDEELRPVMQHILVTKKEICASDAHILVIHQTKDIFSKEFIESMPAKFLIHKEQWKQICKKHIALKFENGAIEVIYNGYSIMHKIKTPEINLVYPDYKKIMLKKKDKEDVGEIGISSELLHKLTDAMFYNYQTKGLKLEFFGQTKHIIVTSSSGESKVKGLIMPIMITE